MLCPGKTLVSVFLMEVRAGATVQETAMASIRMAADFHKGVYRHDWHILSARKSGGTKVTEPGTQFFLSETCWPMKEKCIVVDDAVQKKNRSHFCFCDKHDKHNKH